MNPQLIKKYRQIADKAHQWLFLQHKEFHIKSGLSRCPHRLQLIYAGLLLIAAISVPTAHAWPRGDRYDRLESHFINNLSVSDNFSSFIA